MNNPAGAVVVVTALEDEHLAMLELLENPQRHRHASGTIFTVGGVPGSRGVAALAAIGSGNQTAAVITERAVTEFRPEAVFVVGIAGALHDDLRLGDVVVATKVYGYHGGTAESDAFRARPQAWDADHQLEQLAREVTRDGAWLANASDVFGQPKVVFRPIAAGEVVLNSREAALSAQLRDHYNDAAAIEMEAAGASKASQLNHMRFLTVRGISDKADGNKHAADRAGSQRAAATNAAAVAVAVIKEFLGDDTSGPVAMAPAKAGAVVWSELTEPPGVTWRTDRANRLRTTDQPALEMHLVPVASAGRLTVRSLELLGTSLPGFTRARGLFSSTEELRAESDDRLASVESTSYQSGPAGVAVFRSGQRSAWSPLPRDSMGAVLDPIGVVKQARELLEMLVELDVPAPESVALAVGVEPAIMVTEDQVAHLPRRRASGMRMAEHVRVAPDDAVSYQALCANVAEVADELGARIMAAFRQLR